MPMHLWTPVTLWCAVLQHAMMLTPRLLSWICDVQPSQNDAVKQARKASMVKVGLAGQPAT